jgi:hypothetical protein
MLSSSRARLAYVLSVLAAFVVVLGLAIVVLKQAVLAGNAEAWMMAGVLAVVVGLPLAMVLLPVAGWLQRRARDWRIVPNAGGNVPRVGQ